MDNYFEKSRSGIIIMKHEKMLMKWATCSKIITPEILKIELRKLQIILSVEIPRKLPGEVVKVT